MKNPCRICVVGSANVDLTFRTPRLPQAGETLAGQSLHVGMGGKGANQAVAAARLGAEVAFVARVGNDTFGGEAVSQYQAEGIDTSFIRQDVHRPTGTAAIVVDDDAENCIVIVPGANAELTPADVREASSAIRQADAVLCQLETPLDATLEAFHLARAAGKLTILTPAPVVELPEELLHHCDLCVPNRTEMEFLAGCPIRCHDDAHSAAKALIARGVKSVVVTMGDSGAFLLDDAAHCTSRWSRSKRSYNWGWGCLYRRPSRFTCRWTDIERGRTSSQPGRCTHGHSHWHPGGISTSYRGQRAVGFGIVRVIPKSRRFRCRNLIQKQSGPSQ